MPNPVIVFFDPTHGSNLPGTVYRVPVAYGWDFQCRALRHDEWYAVVVLNDKDRTVQSFLLNPAEPVYIVRHSNSLHYEKKEDIAAKLNHPLPLLEILKTFSHGGNGGAKVLYNQVSALASGAGADLVTGFLTSWLTQTDLMRVMLVRVLLQRIAIDTVLTEGEADVLWLAASNAVEQIDKFPPGRDIEAFQARRLSDCIGAMNSFWIQLTSNLR